MTRAVEVEARRNSRDSTIWQFDISGELGPGSVRHIVEVLDIVRSCRGRVGVLHCDHLSFANAATMRAFMQAVGEFRSSGARLLMHGPRGAAGPVLQPNAKLERSSGRLNVA